MIKYILKHYNGCFLDEDENDFLLLTKNAGEALSFNSYLKAKDMIEELNTISFEICKKINIEDLW